LKGRRSSAAAAETKLWVTKVSERMKMLEYKM
jgi:hypothetical protein